MVPKYLPYTKISEKEIFDVKKKLYFYNIEDSENSVQSLKVFDLSLILVLFLNSKNKEISYKVLQKIVATYKEENDTGFRYLMFNTVEKYFRILR